MKLEQIYDGRFFPCYYYEPNAITVAVTSVQFVQFIHTCAAAVQVHVMVAADGGEVGKVGDDRGLLAAEGQVDEILQFKKLQLVAIA